MSEPEEYLKELGLEWTSVLTEPQQQQEVSGDMAAENMPGQVKKAEEGALTASGLTACVAVAVYDESTGTGYVGHFITQDKDLREVASDISTFNSLLEMDNVDYDQSRAFAGGLDYGIDISERFLDDDKEIGQIAAEGAARNMFDRYLQQKFDRYEVQWGYDETPGPEDSPGAKLLLDANTGIIRYDRQDTSADIEAEQSSNIRDLN